MKVGKMMEIIVGKTAGFCYGVKRAVESAENEINNSEEQVCCLGEIVHNKQVVNELKEKGIKFVENIDEANNKTIIRAHGIPKEVYEKAKQKNIEIIDKIKEIFINNKERYGYRRITLELRNHGYNVNHKKVYRIMVKLGLKPLKRNKRKYSSYKGTIGKIADNLIERDFNAEKPNQKWYTDVTEFNLRG